MEYARMDLIHLFAIVPLGILEFIVRWLTTVTLIPAKMEEHASMDKINLAAIAQVALWEPIVRP